MVMDVTVTLPILIRLSSTKAVWLNVIPICAHAEQQMDDLKRVKDKFCSPTTANNFNHYKIGQLFVAVAKTPF